MIKYIIALLALTPDPYIQYAQTHFSNVSNGYILQSEKSAPHITLAQFYGSEKDLAAIKTYFKQVSSGEKLTPRFTSMSFKKDFSQPNIWWVEMSVARDPEIMKLHTEIKTFLENRKLELINASGDLFNPHLTFARTKMQGIDLNLNTLPFSNGEFALVIGRADSKGQFVEILERF